MENENLWRKCQSFQQLVVNGQAVEEIVLCSCSIIKLYATLRRKLSINILRHNGHTHVWTGDVAVVYE